MLTIFLPTNIPIGYVYGKVVLLSGFFFGGVVDRPSPCLVANLFLFFTLQVVQLYSTSTNRGDNIILSPLAYNYKN